MASSTNKSAAIEELYKVVEDRNWPRVTRLCTSVLETATTTADDDDNNKAIATASESLYQYSDATTGETALHVACRSRPPVHAIRCHSFFI
jgi:hypothetical protein